VLATEFNALDFFIPKNKKPCLTVMDRASIASLFPQREEGSSTFSVMSITWSCSQNTLNPREVKLIRFTSYTPA